MKKILFSAFILLCLVQLALPVKMIFDKEKALNTGKEYKFRTAPVDPYDPFRGKYVTLSFDANRYTCPENESYYENEMVYVSLGLDTAGFAIIDHLSHAEPSRQEALRNDYVLARIDYASGNYITIDYPFNHFYMEESKSQKAEDVYRESNRNRQLQTYALVSVKDGEAVLKDVMVDGVSIKELAKSQ